MDPAHAHLSVDCYAPWIDRTKAQQALGIDGLAELPAAGTYGAIILAVAHREFIELGAKAIRALGEKPRGKNRTRPLFRNIPVP